MHPLLTGWLEKLEPYRIDPQGFQGYSGELDRYEAEMLTFLRNYDAIVCRAYTQPALAHGASILDDNFRGFSHTIVFQPYRLAGVSGALRRVFFGPPYWGGGCGQTLEGGCGFGSGSGCLA